IRAAREPAAARGSIWVRRAAMSANSAPTKKALPTSKAAAISNAVALFIPVPVGVVAVDRQQQPVHSPPVEPRHCEPRDNWRRDPVVIKYGEVGSVEVDQIPDLRESFKDLRHEPSERV